MTKDLLPAGYAEWVETIKGRIQHAQTRAALAVTRELVMLYWEIGNEILERQRVHGWGAKVIERLAADLRDTFPEVRGFSRTNLLYMRAFAAAWPDRQVVQQVAGRLPWGHNQVLLDKLADSAERHWYAQASVQYGWSRNVLVHQVESRLHERQGKAITNFTDTLPAPQSDFAQQVLKDPYNFDFLALAPEVRERDLERGLLLHLQRFMLELGKGFALIGTQYPLRVGGKEFHADMLFFHTRLMCHVVVELKVGEFKPSDTGQMNFYLTAVDNLLKRPEHNGSIGLILCKEKDHVVVQYALAGVAKPIGVAEYILNEPLPDVLADMLPTVEEFETELTPPSPPLPDAAPTARDEEPEDDPPAP
jgi:predicted nuclease of restriction endonuclease-like (RecB) superfamily